MPILAVLDLQHGQIVRGIAGRRDTYRPIVSSLCGSSEPCAVARALDAQLGLREFYLADLDAIAGAPPALDIYDALHAAGHRLWVDAGVRTAADACRLAALDVHRVVIGLETVEGPEALIAACRALGADRVVFSLDLKGGKPLGDGQFGPSENAESIARTVITSGVTQLLVLDIAHVGMGAGTGTAALCAAIHAAFPHVALAAGGGVRDAVDVRRLYQCGVSHVLVASALHDGRLSRADIAALQV